MFQITGIQFPGNSSLASRDALNVGGLMSRFLTYAIILAGLFFFVRLISAGYQYLTSAGDLGKIQGATKGLTSAAIGLVIIITSFFVIQIFQVVFGINILNTL